MRRAEIYRLSLAAVLLVLSAGAARAQSSLPAVPRMPDASASSNRGVPDASDPFAHPNGFGGDLLRRQAIHRAEENKRRMAANAARLLELTQQVQADMSQREPTADDAKRLDEIAKLAHQVRESMRQ